LQHVMMITELEKIVFAAYRPGKETIILKVMRDERYIKQLRTAEIDFVRELESRGHDLQYEFRGVRVN